MMGDQSVRVFSEIQQADTVRGERGKDAEGRKRQGPDGIARTILVPLGTVVWVWEEGNRYWAGEIREHGAGQVIAKGGKGGRGNVHFASPTNQTPLIAEEGEVGETRDLELELRMMVDAALIGQPNVGKSLLIRQVSNARPIVGDYSFTTTQPVPAVVERGWESFTFMELPGLIERKGQGTDRISSYLRHLWRARVLVHLLDGSIEDPMGAINEVNTALRQYNPAFLEKPQIVVVNKIDMPHVRERIPDLQKLLASTGVARYFISAQTGEGVEDLLAYGHKLLHQLPPVVEEEANKVPPPVARVASTVPVVTREGEVFVVSSAQAARLVRLPDLRRFQVWLQLREELAKVGVVTALAEAGIQPGDQVRIGVKEFQWG